MGTFLAVGYEILEHTADIGIRARDKSLEGLFSEATKGLADIAGIWRPDSGEQVNISVTADDLPALLVEWLGEVLYVHDARAVALAAVDVQRVANGSAQGSVHVVPLPEDVEGTQVKAITYHQLRVERDDEGWVADVYVDI